MNITRDEHLYEVNISKYYDDEKVVSTEDDI